MQGQRNIKVSAYTSYCRVIDISFICLRTIYSCLSEPSWTGSFVLHRVHNNLFNK